MSGSTAAISKRRKRIPLEHYDRVSLMLISMIPYSEIEKQLSMSWGKTRQYIRDVIKQVHTDWAEGAALVQDTRRHQIRQGFEALYMKATAKGDLNVAAKVLTELGKLDGCYVPDQLQIQHHGAVGVGISLGSLGFTSPQEVKDRVEYLRQELAARGPQALQAGYATAIAQAHLAGQPPDNITTPTNGTTHQPTSPLVIDVPTSPDDGGDEGAP